MVADRSALLGLMPAARRFPQPWTVEDHNDACFIVKDRSGFALAYVYYEADRNVDLRPIS